MSKTSVTYYLRLDRRPDQYTVSLFSKALGVSPDDLLHGTQCSWQETVRNLMQKQGMNQKQLAESCGLPVSTVSYCLRFDRDARMSAISRFASALGVAPDDLLSDGLTAWPEKVKSLMRAQGMSQRQLAKASGMSDSAVSHYLHPKRPKAGVAIGLASALDVSADGLLHDEDTGWRERVVKLMRERGMSQRQLARASGISDCSVSYYLHPSRRPKTDVVADFAKALGVTPDDLLHDPRLPWQEKVRKLMTEQGMKQRQLARLSGVSEYSISHYLHADHGPNMDMIVGFAKALGVSPEYLLTGNADAENERRFDLLLTYVHEHPEARCDLIDAEGQHVEAVYDTDYESDNGLDEGDDGFEEFQCIAFKRISDGTLFEINYHQMPANIMCDGKALY